MKKILLTGFGLWDTETYNTSWDILRHNPLALPYGWDAEYRQLPVSWREIPGLLDDLLTDANIRAVLCFGMCSHRAINVERLAVNLNDKNRPDASGRAAPGEFVVPGAPPAYWSGLPVASITSALASARVPTAESRSAGGFLCNYTFYHLMHRLATRTPATIGGFIHVPHYETEGGLPGDLIKLAVPIIAAEAVKLADAPVLDFV